MSDWGEVDGLARLVYRHVCKWQLGLVGVSSRAMEVAGERREIHKGWRGKAHDGGQHRSQQFTQKALRFRRMWLGMVASNSLGYGWIQGGLCGTGGVAIAET